MESERTISDDWVVRYDNRWFQLEGQGRYYAPAQGKVLVREGRHGSIAIEYRGRALRWQEISAPSRPAVPKAKPVVGRDTKSCAKRKWVPPANHPLARGSSASDGEASVKGSRNAPLVGLALPSALNAPP